MRINQTLPELLKEKREKLNVSVKKVAEDMGIREKFIHFMEEGKWESFPSKFHLRSYLKAYLNYLKMDSSLIETYREEIFGEEEKKEDEEDSYSIDRKKLLTAISLFFIFLIILIFSFVILP